MPLRFSTSGLTEDCVIAMFPAWKQIDFAMALIK
jgi:hypothetical protein